MSQAESSSSKFGQKLKVQALLRKGTTIASKGVRAKLTQVIWPRAVSVSQATEAPEANVEETQSASSRRVGEARTWRFGRRVEALLVARLHALVRSEMATGRALH